jgi:capsular exopolysaccharide synthesis family protein
VAREDPGSTETEAYRTIRTSIQFMGLDHPLRTVQVTSAQPGEGKTTTLANLAVVLARAGQRVVVVCCDLRRPRVHEFFGLSNAVGFTSVLLGEVPLSQALQRVPGEERLALLASGPEPPNPSELLSGMRAVEIFTALQGLADIVLIDSPPVLPVADAAVVSTRVDGTLLVASVGSSTRKHVHRAMEMLRQVEAPVIGAILNRATGESGYGYGYGYGYSYEYASDERKSARRAGAATPTK